MHMHSRLATSRTDVDPNVVAVGCKRNLYVALSLAKELKDSDLLVLRHVEEASNVALRYDQHVTSAQRVVVVAHIRECVLQHDVSEGTQLARRCVK
jgi:hypothetical protein